VRPVGLGSRRRRHCSKRGQLVGLVVILLPAPTDNNIVYALDRLDEPSADFNPIAERAQKELGTSLTYQKVDVRDVASLNKIVEEIGNKHGRVDGLIAAAGIQQETPALEYTAEDANRMFEVNITGVFMTAQAVAKQMIKFGNGGSIVLIASMSGTIANRVCLPKSFVFIMEVADRPPGPHLPRIQCFQSRRRPARAQPCLRMGRA
jgi:hypothetical protein